MGPFTGGEATAKVRNFLGHLSWISAGYALSRVLTVLINVAAGRWLGPSEYGLFNLALAVGSFVFPLVVWGLPAALVRYASAHPEEREKVYGTVGRLVPGLALLGGVLLWCLRKPLAQAAGVPMGVVDAGLAYAYACGLFVLLTSFSQTEGHFRRRSLMEVAFAILYAGAFVALYFGVWQDHRSAALGIILGYGVAGALLVPIYGRRLTGPASRAWVTPLLSYGFLWMLDGVGVWVQFFFLRFAVNRFLASADVGVLSLYALASVTVAFNLGNVFQTVFLPAAAGHANRANLWTRLSRAWGRAFIPLVLVLAIGQGVALWLAGKDYPFQWPMVGLMSLAGVFCLMQMSLGWVLASEGVGGYTRTVLARAGACLVTLGLALVFIPRWGILGAGVTYLLTYAANWGLLLAAGRAFTAGERGRGKDLPRNGG